MVGQLVRYVGGQHPDLAGCEGRVRWVGVPAGAYTAYRVDWRGKYGIVERHLMTDVPMHAMKVIKKFTKGILAP